tara:strand:+ start:353 stop:1144 length:792 start_codon:yes stop_codon:yes gene_type:complete
MSATTYTTQLQAGLGMLDETRELLDLWQKGDSVGDLYQRALSSGRFPSLSARRLRNIVAECFAPRYLSSPMPSVVLMKRLADSLSAQEFRQLGTVFTCRANPIVADFITKVYWSSYQAGRPRILTADARQFVEQVNRDGLTTTPWSESTKKRVAGYLTGTLADFGFLDPTSRSDRAIVPVRIEPRAAGIVAYDLHFRGLTDSQVLAANDWAIFGLERIDVVDLFKRLALQGWFVLQSIRDSVRLGWNFRDQEELADAFSNGKL